MTIQVCKRRQALALGGAFLASTVLVLPACGGSGSNTSSATGPVARPTASGNARVGEPVILDASTSTVPAGGSVTYQWRVLAPDGSTVALQDAGTEQPYFLPTAAGNYTAELTISVVVAPFSATSPTATTAVAVAAPLELLTAEQALANVRALAATPLTPSAPNDTSPVLTVGAPGAASTLPGSRLVAWDRPFFSYTGAMGLSGPIYPDELLGSNQAVSYSTTQRSGNVLAIDFVTDAAAFEVFQKGLGFNSQMRVVVDGRLANNVPLFLDNDGGTYLTRVTFASKASRRIRLLINNPYFGGVRLGSADKISRPPTGTRLRALFLGDSITESVAGQNAISPYAARTADLLGWADAWVSGVGATGYLAAAAPKLTLRQRFASDVKAYAPNVLVVAAGINDINYSDAEIQAEATLLFDQIQAELPATLVFVAGPWGTPSRVRPGVNTALKAAMGTRPHFYWVPNVDDAWLTGTGNAGRPAGNGNADQYISADTTHPTPAGIEYIAGKLAAFVKLAVQ